MVDWEVMLRSLLYVLESSESESSEFETVTRPGTESPHESVDVGDLDGSRSGDEVGDRDL
jgi:hypothetical protein